MLRLVIVVTLTLMAAGLAIFEGERLWRAVTAGAEGAGQGAGGPPGMGGLGRGTGGYSAPEARVATTAPTRVTPEIAAYGRLAAQARASVWAPAAGTVALVRDGLADGTRVPAGALLVQLDDAAAGTAVQLAEAALHRARLAQEETTRQAEATRADLDRQQQILEIRQAEARRIRTLLDKGSGVQSDLDSARLAVIDAEQSLVDSRNILAELANTARQDALEVSDAGAELASARRALGDLGIRAGITGVFHGTVPVVGEALSSGAELGVITDLDHLQARLDLTAQEIDRIQAPGGGLQPLAVTLQSPGGTRSYPAVLSHVTLAEDDTTGTARTVIAQLDPAGCPCPLPGSFVTARIAEPALEQVVVLPATALSVDGKALVLGQDDRLREVQMTVLRRLGNNVAVAAPETPLTYVRERSPQLGAGLRVRPVPAETATEAATEAGGQADAGAPVPGTRATGLAGPGASRAGSGGAPDGPMVPLDDSRRAALAAQVRASDLSEGAQARMLALLRRDEVPQGLIDQLSAGN
ncbi:MULTISPECIES: efflux RND transporter periplasmic adaptor subunit [Pseudooceanicola]|nr:MULTISPECIES: HlyD family efflux transporter periplasmic adaptor subunit [Pseudooceanicola]